jgi:hypothetical protein
MHCRLSFDLPDSASNRLHGRQRIFAWPPQKSAGFDCAVFEARVREIILRKIRENRISLRRQPQLGSSASSGDRRAAPNSLQARPCEPPPG